MVRGVAACTWLPSLASQLWWPTWWPGDSRTLITIPNLCVGTLRGVAACTWLPSLPTQLWWPTRWPRDTRYLNYHTKPCVGTVRGVAACTWPPSLATQLWWPTWWPRDKILILRLVFQLNPSLLSREFSLFFIIILYDRTCQTVSFLFRIRIIGCLKNSPTLGSNVVYRQKTQCSVFNKALMAKWQVCKGNLKKFDYFVSLVRIQKGKILANTEL